MTIGLVGSGTLITVPALGQIQADGYSCSTLANCEVEFSRTHNKSTDITVRTLTCRLPTSVVHWYDMAADFDLAGVYATLKCVDFSLWSSSFAGDQEIFIRVFQDLDPGRGTHCPDHGFGDSANPGPDVDGGLLIWEGTTTFPQSQEGVESETTPRADGDRSIRVGQDVNGTGFPTGLLLPPDAQFFVEVGHMGEAVTRFGANNAGETGDDAGPDSADVTWVRAPNCGGGGCISTCVGTDCIGTAFAKYSEWIPDPDLDRDVVMRVHLDVGDTTTPFCDLCVKCRGDANEDSVIDGRDLLAVLRDWTPSYCLENIWDRRTGDVFPCCVDGRVDIDDLLDVLAHWGYCPLRNDDCADGLRLLSTAFWHNVTATNDGPTHPDLGIGSYCGFDEELGDVFGPGDIWFWYWGPCPGRVTFSTEGASGIEDTIMEVWPGWSCDDLSSSPIACNDDVAPGNAHSRISLDVESGDALLIRLAGRAGEEGQGVLTATFEPAATPDCNGNGINDTCDIRVFFNSRDRNGNGVPDECDARGDFDGDGVVSVTDLIALLAAWGPCGSPCPPDTNGDGLVGITDLLTVLANWG